MAKTIMLMGTSSHVGKSILTTALCRIFLQEGRRVVPFKAQNMALNSYVTLDGREMGRAQVAQAEAAGLAPMIDMNPVLLKPTGNAQSQVVIMGEPVGNMSAREYHTGYSLKAWDAVEEALKRLQDEYELIVIEGAGSPAEINLKANDIVNMRVAKHLNAPVLLIADIDRGGALASLVGTLELLDEEERALVKGLVINKFRGDVTLLTPALEFLEKKTGKPVLGVVPHVEQLGIDEEDSVSLDEKSTHADAGDAEKIRVAVIRTPKLSNFTDFDALADEPDVTLYYVSTPAELGSPDLILLPGSKNTTEDLLYIRQCGLEDAIRRAAAAGTPLFGICGGYQMLGRKVRDPLHTESEHDEIAGFGYLPSETTFAAHKRLRQVTAQCEDFPFLGERLAGHDLPGYEIHMGETVFTEEVHRPFRIVAAGGAPADAVDGAISVDGLVAGTYIHGIFDDDELRRSIINRLRTRRGLAPLPVQYHYRAEKERAYDRLAETVRKSLDMEKLRAIVGMGADA
ncbi:cobyric acid synthase [uncultured Selenomonas sp.]|uniref:cobyric acid synthase n=1 Tax=uncultured Selenomonas sp. TaxID=159275 RepID=UPI00258D82D2|nr:cobyric acid synthase [uncultured Selenomonas sp.]